MCDDKKEAHPPPPAYTPYPESGDATGTRQQCRESSGLGHRQHRESTPSKNSFWSLFWRKVLRREAPVSSTEPPRQQPSHSSQHLAWTREFSISTTCEGENHCGYCHCRHFYIFPSPVGGPVDGPDIRVPTTCLGGRHCGTCHCGRFNFHTLPPADQMGIAAPGGEKTKTATDVARWPRIVKVEMRLNRTAEMLQEPPIPSSTGQSEPSSKTQAQQ